LTGPHAAVLTMLVSGCTATQPEAGIDAGGVLTRPG